MASARGFLTATEAAARLGVKAATLYAYVSRGLLRSEATDGARARRYVARDVERLLERRRMREEPSLVAARALWWGAPVVESSISFVDGKRIFYRGIEAVSLSERTSYERVASLLWTGSLGGDEPWAEAVPLPAAAARVVESVGGESTFLAQLQLLIPLFALGDESRFDTSPAHVVATAKRLIMNLTMALSVARQSPRKRRRASGVANGLFFSLSGRAASEAAGRAMDRALVLCAEHELNASTFAARVAASAGADPYAVVTAALATLGGPKHGGACDRIEALVREVERPERAARVVFARTARGEAIPGFGHPLYPDGDPRASPLLEMARDQRAPKASATLETILAIIEATAETSHGAPTLDIALVAVAAALQLPPGSAACIFAIGRIAGWIAHALEQYAMDQLIRPRARYIGPKVEAS
jgi:citrate synthase